MGMQAVFLNDTDDDTLKKKRFDLTVLYIINILICIQNNFPRVSSMC